ncbi:MAG TPA: FAD-dependent oxidoreductase [Polyangiaceae bacterium]|nr:FAD-dependent oxidoreductase [Polyangiaceae bacterium]
MTASADPSYDVVIIGAGLAGLAAAYALRDRKIVVLEREPRPGGRVLTRYEGEFAYDLGALFAFDPRAAPFPLRPPPLRRESRRVGLFAGGALRFGTTVAECVRATDLTAAERDAFDDFGEGLIDAADLPPAVYRPLNSFFRLIHPGELRDYLPERQRDALAVFDTRHYETGNGALVDEFERRLGHVLRLGVDVLSIAEVSGRVEVAFRGPEGRGALAARAAVCAAPGPAARRLLATPTNDRCRTFLESLRYGEGTVVALAFRGADIADFAYVVTPDLALNAVIKHAGRGGEPDLLFAYYVGEASERLSRCPPGEPVRQALADLRRLGIGALPDSALAFAEALRWPTVGPVISPASYAGWDRWQARASERVFLAGDYVHVEPHAILPFGTTAALRSGAEAAEAARAYLDAAPEVEAFRSEHLVEASVYELDDDRPRFVGLTSEGNVSFYGLLLQADPDPALARYLLASARDSLWEYQVGFGVTSDDSVLALEGLLEAGAGRDLLEPSFERLVELFYSEPLGAFQAISERRDEVKACAQGRAAYWLAPSLDATAQAAYLLLRFDPVRYRPVIEACARYVAAAQRSEGGWRGLWFCAEMATTFQALRLLAALGGPYDASVRRAATFVAEAQGPDGSWAGSVLQTAAAVRALGALGRGEDEPVRRAKAWLRARETPAGWAGEPLIYYWFETEPGRKTLFHCRDKGKITTAWARLALAA